MLYHDDAAGLPDSPANKFPRPVASSIQRVFVVVDRFRDLAARGAEARLLAPLIDELAADAAECFVGCAMQSAQAVALDPDHVRCLADLRDLAPAVAGRNPPPRDELLHALDSLIVHCAVLDADQRDPMRTWPIKG